MSQPPQVKEAGMYRVLDSAGELVTFTSDRNKAERFARRFNGRFEQVR